MLKKNNMEMVHSEWISMIPIEKTLALQDFNLGVFVT